MADLRGWIGWGLLVGVAIGAACSSDDAKKAPSVSAGSGGEGNAEGGSAAVGDGGSVDQAGAISSAAGAAGAAGDETLTDGWLSGSRLRARLDVAGSAKMFRSWHDSELGIDCQFAFDADGVERCLPDLDNPYAVYSDDECQVPVVVLDDEQPLPAFVREPYGEFECHKGANYFELGAVATGVTETYSAANGGCAPNGAVGETQVVMALAAKLPASTFVAASKRIREPRDERLEANVRIAEDGSRHVTDHFDLQRAADCNPREHKDQGFACAPEDRAYIQVFFEDDACSVPAAYHPAYAHQVCGREPTIIQDSSPNHTDEYFEVGSEITTPIFTNSTATPDTCAPYEATYDPGATYYNVGEHAPWSGFPPLSLTNEGAGRVAITVLRGENDELISRNAFFDTELGVACGVGEATDHELHCIPHTPFSVNSYSDAECSEAVFEMPGGEPLPADLEFLVGNALGGGAAIFKIGAKAAVPEALYQMNGLECEQRAITEGADYYATEAIPAEDLAAVTTEIE
jgi:hypothetical protein